MNAQSAKALFWLAVILLVLAGAIGAPVARVFVFGLAALLAAIPAAFGCGRLRLLAAAAMLIGLVAASMNYLDDDQSYYAYRQRSRTPVPTVPSPPAEAPQR